MLIRYGIKWSGPREPIGTEMSDGYWTPWHIANDEVSSLRSALRDVKRTALTTTDSNAGLAHIVRICIDAGIAEKLPDLSA